VTIQRLWRILNVFHVNLLEPYQTSTWREALDAAQVFRHYDNIRAGDCTIEELMGSSYDKRNKRVIFIVQWFDYSDREDWIEEPFEHMTTALEKHGEFHKTNPDPLRDPHLSHSEGIFLFPKFNNT
jgi:hypothetical protein